MDILKLVKKYLINSQLFVSLMGTLFALYFMRVQNSIKTPTILLIFITFFSGYLYTKYQGSRLFRKVIIFNVLCGIVSVCLIISNHNEVRLFKWAVIVGLGLLYNSSFLAVAARRIPLFKIFYVGFTWALVTSWLILPKFDAAIFSLSFLFISALVLPFDIRDKDSDTVTTFPQLIGIARTKYLAYFLVFGSILLAGSYLPVRPALAFFLAASITFILIYFSTATRSDGYFTVWVESCSALPLFFLLLLEFLQR